jgi:hypothetical protein
MAERKYEDEAVAKEFKLAAGMLQVYRRQPNLVQ